MPINGKRWYFISAEKTIFAALEIHATLIDVDRSTVLLTPFLDGP